MKIRLKRSLAKGFLGSAAASAAVRCAPHRTFAARAGFKGGLHFERNWEPRGRDSQRPGRARSPFSTIGLTLAAVLAFSVAGCVSTPDTDTWHYKFQYNVRDFGAVGDGTTKDTVAFQKALDTCAVNGGGEVLVPAGNYLIGSVQMGFGTLLRLQATNSVIIGSGDASDYPSMDIRWEGRWQPGRRALIYAANVDHTAIIGPGRIEGNRAMAAPQNPRGAVVLEPISCNDVRWEGFTVTQGGNWATHPTYCSKVTIKNLHIIGDRDGIDIDSCKDVRIEGCDINTGDDCISLKSGRGLNGARIGKPTEGVVISHCTLRGRRFAGVGIGSETSGGVYNVRMEHCKTDCRTFGIYIKTRVGRAGAIDNIFGDDIDVLGGGFLKINLVSAGNLNTSDDPVEGDAGIPSGKNYSFSNIHVTNCARLVDAREISPKKPLAGFSLVNVTGTCTNGISLANMTDVKLKNIQVTGFQGALVTQTNVQGAGDGF